MFLFSVDMQHPLLIDEGLQAVTLPNLVVGVQSTFTSWPSHLECNGKMQRVNLRDPTSALVLAVAQHLGGLLPVNMGDCHGPTSGADWLWAVGDSARNPLSTMPFMTGFDVDIAQRHWTARWTDALVARLNVAVAELEGIRATRVGLEDDLRSTMDTARQSYVASLKLLQNICDIGGRIDRDPQPTVRLITHKFLRLFTDFSLSSSRRFQRGWKSLRGMPTPCASA